MATVSAQVMPWGRQLFGCQGKPRGWTLTSSSVLAVAITSNVSHAQLHVDHREAVAPHEERCAIDYQAPPSCPAASAMAEAAGPHFRVVTHATCTDCVSKVNITPTDDGSGEYVLRTGDESTRSADCAELVKIAGFTVRSSHIHQTPAPTPPFLYLGLHAGQTIARDLQWMFGAQVGLRLFDDWLVRPHVGWIPESRVTVLINNDRLDPRFTAYHGGLDICRLVTSWAGVCAQSSFESFRVVPSAGQDWDVPRASQVTVGLGATFQTRVVSDLLVQLQPGVVYAPQPAKVLESDWSATLYERPVLQVQLRAGLAWGIGGNDPSDEAGANFAQTGPARITQ